MALGCLASLFGIRDKAPAPSAAPSAESGVPESLPLEVKRPFFSRDESAFFAALEETLDGTPYRVFPNVRLNDLFRITTDAQRGAVYARLRDKHVDFLIVHSREGHRPLLGIELDGLSHRNEKQQHRDAVKDVAFRSAGLPLLRLTSRAYGVKELRDLLAQQLPGKGLSAS